VPDLNITPCKLAKGLDKQDLTKGGRILVRRLVDLNDRGRMYKVTETVFRTRIVGSTATNIAMEASPINLLESNNVRVSLSHVKK